GDLGVAAGAGRDGGRRPALGPGLRHAAAWALLFFVPLAFLVSTTDRRMNAPLDELQQTAMLVAAAPDSFETHAMRGYALAAAGKMDAGFRHFERSIGIYDGSARAHFTYACALELAGRTEPALTHYQRALL